MTPVEEALQAGYSQDEINGYLAEKTQKAKAAGYSDQEIQGYVKDNLIQQPAFNDSAVAAPGHARLSTRPAPTTVLDAVKTGWNWGTFSLGAEAMKPPGVAKLPEMAVDETTPWNLRIASTAATLANDVPAMIAGGLIGGAAGGPFAPIAAWGGAGALPLGLRKVFIDAINDGSAVTKQDVSERVLGTVWETIKGYVVGAATGLAGKYAGISTAALPRVAAIPLQGTAEWATMSEVAARLEGHAPTPESLVDNALLLGVMKTVLPSVRPEIQARTVLHETYVKTGIPPEQVTQDALKGTGVWQDLLDGHVPDAYKAHVEQEPSGPTQTQRTKEFKSPTLTPEQADLALGFLEKPFAEIPQAPNEPSRPGHINYNYRQTDEEAYLVLARTSQIYEEKIQDARKSPTSWEQSANETAQVLANLLGSDAKTVLKFVQGDPKTPSVTAQNLAKKELTLLSAEELMRKRTALLIKGPDATMEDLLDFLAQGEHLSKVHAGFLGYRADVARANNALKSTKTGMERVTDMVEAVNSYGGPDKVAHLVKLLGEYDNPGQVVQFASKMTKATTWEKVIEAWKAGLVSGLRTNEVNFLSTLAFTTLKLPVEAMSAVNGLLRGHDERVLFSELPARIVGMAKGTYDGLKVAGAIIRSGTDVTGAKTDTFRTAIGGTTGEVVRLPFRALAASDALLATTNERGELYALATRQTIQEGKTFGTKDFWGRVADLAQNPTPEMKEASESAGLRYTFRTPLGPGGKSFQQTIRNWPILQLVFPFTTTPGNIFKETARMTPGLNFAVKEWREDYTAGGIRRDRALAEVAVGAAIMSQVVLAALNGTVTGGGNPDRAQRETDRAAGWKPYSIKINGHYIDGYLRMAPIGPLIGLAADGTEFFQYMTHDERDQWARMLGFAFAQNVTNQSMMTGATNLVNMMQEPARYGENYFEALASSVVPGLLGQYAAERDPLVREIHGMKEAIQARIPLVREGLIPKTDLFGQPIKNPERLWLGSPFTTTAISTDKVRTEAARLGFASPQKPGTIDVIPGVRLGKADQVELTPERKDIFNTRAGQLAYDVLQQAVNAPGWDQQPPIAQRRMYELAFKDGRHAANMEMLERIWQSGGQAEAMEKVDKQLHPTQ